MRYIFDSTRVEILRNDVVEGAWTPVDLAGDEDPEMWQIPQIAVAVPDWGMLYILPIDQKIEQAHQKSLDKSGSLNELD